MSMAFALKMIEAKATWICAIKAPEKCFLAAE